MSISSESRRENRLFDKEARGEPGKNGQEQIHDVELGPVEEWQSSGRDNPAFEKNGGENENSSNANGITRRSGSEPTHENAFGVPSTNIKDSKKIAEKLKTCLKKNSKAVKGLVLIAFIVLYIVYFSFAVHISWSKSDSWCEGSKFLTIITACTVLCIIYYHFIKRYCGKCFETCLQKIRVVTDKITSFKYFSIIAFILLMGVIFVTVIVEEKERQNRLISYSGLWTLLILGFVFSKHPRKVRIRQVAWGIGLQFVFALIILRWSFGKDVFQCLGDKVSTFLAFTDQGSEFVFGYLVSGKLNGGSAEVKNLTMEGRNYNVTYLELNLPNQIGVFAFKVLPVVLFFSFCVSILYYYGVMQWLVLKIGWILEVTVGTTAAESMNAAGNIFMGQTEAPLLVKPYLPSMTKSELHVIMTGGFATIAGGVLAAYIGLGINASHLLSASVMSAPAALAYAKLFYPETEESQTTITTIKIEKGKERNALEAASVGVAQAIGIVATIAASLVAFVAFIYFLDFIVNWFGSLVGWEFLSLTYLMSKVFMPLAFMMGVSWEECAHVGQLIGLKTIVNEFVAYQQLSQMKTMSLLSKRSEIIATYALCGFSNLASIGIQIGGLGAMAPQRMPDIAAVAFRAMISGSAACFLTACVAGALMTDV